MYTCYSKCYSTQLCLVCMSICTLALQAMRQLSTSNTHSFRTTRVEKYSITLYTVVYRGRSGTHSCRLSRFMTKKLLAMKRSKVSRRHAFLVGWNPLREERSLTLLWYSFWDSGLGGVGEGGGREVRFSGGRLIKLYYWVGK